VKGAGNLLMMTQMYTVTHEAAQHLNNSIIGMTHGPAFPRAWRRSARSARSTASGSTSTLAGGPINRVLLPRADIATDTLAAGLLDMGWEVDDVTAYRTVRAAPPPAPVREAIKADRFDAVLFTSSSTVRNLVGIAGKPHATTVVACIGPRTAPDGPGPTVNRPPSATIGTGRSS